MKKAHHLIQWFHHQIITGHFQPGKPIPNYQSLLQNLKVSRATLYEAIQTLKNQGVLLVEGRRGMSIAPQLPYTQRMVLALPPHSPYNFFFSALKEAVTHVKREKGMEIEIAENIQEFPPSPTYNQLLQSVTEYRYGAIFVVYEGKYMRRIMEHQAAQQLPIIFFGDKPDNYQRFPSIKIDSLSFFEQAFQWLHGRKRSLVGIIRYQMDDLHKEGQDLALHWNLTVPEDYQLAVDIQYPKSVERTIYWMFRQKELRPNALLVLDDHLIVPVLKGIIRFPEIRIGEDLDIVSLGNWPRLPSIPFPIKFIGVDMVEVVQTGINFVNKIFHQDFPEDRVIKMKIFSELP